LTQFRIFNKGGASVIFVIQILFKNTNFLVGFQSHRLF